MSNSIVIPSLSIDVLPGSTGEPVLHAPGVKIVIGVLIGLAL